MKIGNIELENNLMLAPMAGISDMTYRVLAKKMGAGLVVTEMVSAKGLFYNDKKTEQLMRIHKDERPVALQIFGSDPEIMGRVVLTDINSREDIDIVDINMGCPAPKIVKNGDGSALMKNPDLVRRIINSVVEASDKPVSVKLRIGWDDNNLNGLEIAKIAEAEGASMVTVHGRTREMFYTGSANWDYIKMIKEELKIPVIGNGDVFDYKDAKSMFDYTGVDGIAIGRGAIGNPFIFKSIDRYLKAGEEYVPSYKEIIDIILVHLDAICIDKGERIGVREMRKHISFYLKGMPGSAKIKDIVNKQEKKEDVKNILLSYLETISN